MAADQKNFSRFTYVDNNGVSWNKRGELDTVRNAVDGSTASGGHVEWGAESRNHSVRKGVYTDSTTFRTKTIILYTAAAAAALTPGTSTLAFHVEGETGTVTYTYGGLIAERQPKSNPVRNLADHA
jgi:glycine/D-amino acid oxidase-like deaminating enzyme